MEDLCPPYWGNRSAAFHRGRRRGPHRARLREPPHATPRGLARRGTGSTSRGTRRGNTRRASTLPASTRRASPAPGSLRAPWSRARRRGWPWRWTRRAAAGCLRATAPPTPSCSSTTRRRRPRRGARLTYSPRPPRTHSARSELRFSSQFF